MATSSTPERSRTYRLPAEVTSFVGRRHELGQVKRLLSGSRLVTLVGPGGVGKTRLAARVAYEVRRGFADGVWLVELAELENPALVAQSVLDAVGIPDHSSRPPIAVLSDQLRDRHALLILDNCEHLPQACAETADALLRAVPRLRIMATSRQPLGLPYEQTFSVPPLPVGDGRLGSTDPLAQSDAVRLFIERARAVLPDFTLTDANRDEIERICRRLDGIPLGIELAAVRLRALSPRQLLDRLDDRFALLTSGSRAALPRHQTLRALIDWSYSLCTGPERLMWQRASAFSGGLDLEAAEEVCYGDGIERADVFGLITALVEKSVLFAERHGPGTIRYRLPETVRQYGRDRLRESGQEETIRRRHRDRYQAMVARLEDEWFGPGQVAWYTRLCEEHGNLRAALGFCLETPGEAGAGLAVATALRYYWIAAGRLHEGRRWLDALLAGDTEPTARRGAALCVNARLAVLQSDIEVANGLLEESRALAERLGDAAIRAQIEYVTGLAALIQEDFTGAVEHLGDACERHRAIGHAQGIVNSLMYLAAAHSFLDRSAEAMVLFEECLELCETRGEHWFRSYALCVFGIEVWQRGQTARAIEIERESIRLKRPFNDRLGIAMCVEVLAWIAAGESRYERAALLLGALREAWRSAGGPLFAYMAEHHRQCEAATRKYLGDTRFDEITRQGTALGFEELIACALEPGGRTRRPAVAGCDDSPLTAREMEVARLVAEGKSNKEIARALVIAQRTAEGHVQRILNKLGFNTRAQIAAWATRRDPPPDDVPPG